MSELTEELDWRVIRGLRATVYELRSIIVAPAKTAGDWLDAMRTIREREAEIAALKSEIATALREQMEADCRTVCPACSAAQAMEEAELDAPFDLHSGACESIRAVWAKAHPEDG